MEKKTMPSKSRTLNLQAILPTWNGGFIIVDASKKAVVSEHFTVNFGVTDDWMVEPASTKRFNTLTEALMHADLLGLKNVKVVCDEAGEFLPEFKKLAGELIRGLSEYEFTRIKEITDEITEHLYITAKPIYLDLLSH